MPRMLSTMRVAIILGTRPEIIKMAPVIRACQARREDHFILHTGQHYSYEMDKVFFEQLELPDPKHNLDVGSGTHGKQTGRMLADIERVLLDEKPDVVLVQGDTNTVVAGALAASKLHIKVGHVEAGLRSFDRGMPEEINRIVADHVSDWLFAPTAKSADLLRKEGLPESRIHVTGNTIVDAVLQNKLLAEKKGKGPHDFGAAPGKYVLVTAHRAENVDVATRFQGILDGANRVARELGVPAIYPIHPRARKMLHEHKLDAGDVHIVDPFDFMTFLRMESHASIVLTDSGGVQEETCILGVPCVTLRDNTERPETVDVGANVLAGTDADAIVAAARKMRDAPRKWENPFGDGTSADKILTISKGA